MVIHTYVSFVTGKTGKQNIYKHDPCTGFFLTNIIISNFSHCDLCLKNGLYFF